jgi:hypothetical protein
VSFGFPPINLINRRSCDLNRPETNPGTITIPITQHRDEYP